MRRAQELCALSEHLARLASFERVIESFTAWMGTTAPSATSATTTPRPAVPILETPTPKALLASAPRSNNTEEGSDGSASCAAVGAARSWPGEQDPSTPATLLKPVSTLSVSTCSSRTSGQTAPTTSSPLAFSNKGRKPTQTLYSLPTSQMQATTWRRSDRQRREFSFWGFCCVLR